MFTLKNMSKPLFIFELANNHMGDVEHGVKIIRAFKEVSKEFDMNFSFKLQHRDDSFFHPDYLHRKDMKYIKRFTETKLSFDDFKRLKDEIVANGFISMCTPWDEPSVDLMDEMGFEIIKVASCSFLDWSLLERIVKSNKPIIASTAGAGIEDIDRVVSFLAHRNKDFAIMHCVGEYPCLREHLELNPLDYFRSRYPEVLIGFSTHEEPENFDSIRIAVAKGAALFEKHVALVTEKYDKNAYSATPEQVKKWLIAAVDTYKMCGVKDKRKVITEKEMADLVPLYRGAFANREVRAGEKIAAKDLFLAMPNTSGQLVARDLSKYSEFYAKKSIKKNGPIMADEVEAKELRSKVLQIVNNLRKILKESHIVLPPYVDIEISHHYGIEKFDEWGAILIKVINRAYSKILVVMFPGQSYPRHRHNQKDESYHLLFGDLLIEVDGVEKSMATGELLSINKNTPHSFRTKAGAIIEEIATTYLQGDSVYEDDTINKNSDRKTFLTFWPDWMKD